MAYQRQRRSARITLLILPLLGFCCSTCRVFPRKPTTRLCISSYPIKGSSVSFGQRTPQSEAYSSPLQFSASAVESSTLGPHPLAVRLRVSLRNLMLGKESPGRGASKLCAWDCASRRVQGLGFAGFGTLGFRARKCGLGLPTTTRDPQHCVGVFRWREGPGLHRFKRALAGILDSSIDARNHAWP